MTVKKHSIPLKLENRVYAVQPTFSLVREIEHELGGIADLRARFAGDAWRVSDLVVLAQMMLQAAGKTVDYVALGDALLREGVAHYLAAAQVFLDMVLHGE